MFEERSITVIGASGSDSSPSVGAEARRGERRLLLISYHFPPSREVGARRWQQLSKFASEWDWTVDVVTLDPANIAAPDWAALEELPAGVRVYSVAERTLWWAGDQGFQIPSMKGWMLSNVFFSSSTDG